MVKILSVTIRIVALVILGLLAGAGVLIRAQAIQMEWAITDEGCNNNDALKFDSAKKVFKCQAPASGGVPTGAILLINAGACPSGFTEDSTLNGKTLFGTLAVNADVGGTGGADALTPAGTVEAPTFAGSALGTHTHGSGTYAVGDHASHTHTYTDVVNHVHVENAASTAQGPNTGSSPDTSTNNSVATDYSTANPTGGVATGTTAGPSAALTHALSGSSEALSAGTPAGTNSAPAFTGAQFDNRSAYMKVIFCKAN